MAIDSNAEYLVQRGSSSFRSKHGNIQNACTSGDYIFYDAGNGTSRRVEYNNWDKVPNDAKLLVNLNGASRWVSGANFKTALGPPPLPSGNRSVSWGNTNEVGYSYMAVNNDTSNAYGTSASQSGAALMRLYLRVNNGVMWWTPGDYFSFFHKHSGSCFARIVPTDGGAMSQDAFNYQWSGWGPGGEWVTTLNGANNVSRIDINVTGSGQITIASTKCNGIIAGTGAGSGSLPNFRPTRAITNTEGKVLMIPKYDWETEDGELIYPELKESHLNGEILDPHLSQETWMTPGNGLARTVEIGDIAEWEGDHYKGVVQTYN